MAFHRSSFGIRLWTVSKLIRLEQVRLLTASTDNNVKPLEEDVVNKLIYSSKGKDLRRGKWFQNVMKGKNASGEKKTSSKQSIALSLYADTSEQNIEEKCENAEKVVSPVVMPMGLKVAKVDRVEEVTDEDVKPGDPYQDSSTKSLRKVWSNDYVKITHALDPEEPPENDWMVKYGSANPSIPSSKVPCGGCGALLHCKDTAIPGFIPEEIFSQCKTADLRTTTCQRCYFLQNHNMALSIAVNPQIYPQIIRNIKRKNALVLLAIDVTDFPCSIWPGITDLVGLECPFFLVGNKVDLLKGDHSGWMTDLAKSLRLYFPRKARILGTQLISAKTGFGVEDLITNLQLSWKYQGDVYLVGCTNVGKSTLFNALLQSDYCKVKAADLVQRATTAPWPGTTLNLLKFPIMRPEGWRLYLRTRRIQNEESQHEGQLRKQQKRNDKKRVYSPPQLIGHIGRTFHLPVMEHEDAFAAPDLDDKKEVIPGSGLNPNDPDFIKGKWFYDTPGVLHADQILDLLTTEELLKVLPQSMLEPRTFVMKPGWTMFIGGVARVDFIQCSSNSVRWTVFVSKELPITICFTSDAQETYDQLLGSKYFIVPSGEPERLAKWPGLESKDEVKFSGVSKMVSCGDLVLSSCGWVSFAPDKKEIITVKAWTPQARGIYTRPRAVLPYAVNQVGAMINGTPAFYPTKKIDF